MKLFSFFKRQPKSEPAPAQTIRRLVDYMPEFYQSHEYFIDAVDFLEHREWELALDSLIALADETGHYFSEEFWLGLAHAAGKMNLNERADYCREQIKRNEKDIQRKTPFGWTTVKFDEHIFSIMFRGN